MRGYIKNWRLRKEKGRCSSWRGFLGYLMVRVSPPGVGREGVQDRHLNDRTCTRISKEEVKGTLRKMKSEKAVGPNLIPVEILEVFR